MPTINYTYSANFAPGTYHPVQDTTGQLPANKVTGEVHTITAENGRDFAIIVPLFGPFFASGLSLSHEPLSGPVRTLVEGVDYLLGFSFIGASRGCAKPVYGAISLLNNQLVGKIRLNQYQTLGGNWCLSVPQITEILANRVANPRVITWEQVTNYPTLFPPSPHEWNLVDLVGMKEVVDALNAISTTIANRPAPVLPVDLVAHLNDFANPHHVTKAQVGLALANNYATATVTEAVTGTANNLHVTPAGVKAAVEQASAAVQLELEAHIGDLANPHAVTKAQVGLSNIGNYPVATTVEAQAHVANDRYMTPARTWDEILAAFADGTLNLNAANAAFSGAVTALQLRAARGAGANSGHGFSFAGEAAFDSGMFSPAENYVDFYSGGQLQIRLQSADGMILTQKRVQSAYLPMYMAQNEGATLGSFVCRSQGTGDSNMAGMTFWNDAYAIKMGVRADGYWGLGGYSRAPWSLYSDPSGNLTAGGNVTAYSDPLLKENQTPITDALAKLRLLSGMYFDWKSGIPHTALKAGKRDLGVMADQVEQVFPEMVSRSIPIGGVSYRTVAYEKLTPVLLEGLKEVDDKAIEQGKRLQFLEEENARLNKVVDQMASVFEMWDKRLKNVEKLVD